MYVCNCFQKVDEIGKKKEQMSRIIEDEITNKKELETDVGTATHGGITRPLNLPQRWDR